jgi:hypothetical protein
MFIFEKDIFSGLIKVKRWSHEHLNEKRWPVDPYRHLRCRQ